MAPENIGPQRAERRRAPALALLVSLTSGLLLLLLLWLLGRARASRAARMLPARTTRLQPPARALLLQSQTIAARLVTLSPRDQRVSAALRRAAAPYADGCEQIFVPSQPISY